MSGWHVLVILTIILAIAEGLAIVALARAIGILQLRLGPEPGALNVGEGLRLYERAPAVTGFDLGLQKPRMLSFEGHKFAIIFVEAICRACRQIVRDAGRIEASGLWNIRLVVIAKGSHEQNRILKDMAPRLMFLSDPSGDMQRAYGVESTPFAFLIDDGQIQAKGIVNHRDHLESLLDSVTTVRDSMPWVPASNTEKEDEDVGIRTAQEVT
jgi:hypothetical protein